MELTELADYMLPAGQLVEWIPTAAEHWADWPRDHRSASFNHERHLRDALNHRRKRESKHSWVGHAYRIDGTFDARAWSRAVEAWIDRHEILRSHVTVEGGKPARYTLPPGEVRIVGRTAGDVTTPMSAHRHVQQLLDESTEPLHWPSYLFVTITQKHGFTVVFAADHSITDGYSTVVVAIELRALYAAALAHPDDTTIDCPAFTAGELPETGSYLDYSELERIKSADVTAAAPAVELWRRFLADAPTAADTNGPEFACTFPLHAGDQSSTRRRSVPQRTLSLWMMDDRTAEVVTCRAREQGHGLFAALLAGFAAATTEFTADTSFRTIIPRHTRTDLDYLSSLGWFVGLSPFHIRTEGVTRFGDLIPVAGRELIESREAASVPFARICELLGAAPWISFVVSYMDLRAIPHIAEMPGWNTRWLRSGSASPDDHYFWFARLPDGVTVNMRFPGTAKATHDVHRIVLRIRALLAQFAEYGDAHLRPNEAKRNVQHIQQNKIQQNNNEVLAWK